ncbi:MAG: hypothetical protein WD847_15505 [Pirellulales bacterium]
MDLIDRRFCLQALVASAIWNVWDRCVAAFAPAQPADGHRPPNGTRVRDGRGPWTSYAFDEHGRVIRSIQRWE